MALVDFYHLSSLKKAFAIDPSHQLCCHVDMKKNESTSYHTVRAI